MKRERVPCERLQQRRPHRAAVQLLALLSGLQPRRWRELLPPRPAASRARVTTLPRHAAARESVTRPEAYAGALSYLAAGRGQRRVAFVHGTPGAAEDWVDYLLDVPDDARYLALDRPGFGRSDPDEAVVSLRDQAGAVLDMLTADASARRVPDEPAILVGHSLGAPVVARAAIDAPARVAALVLLAGALDPALERVYAVQRVAAWAPLARALPRPVRNANAELLALEQELADMCDALERLELPVIIVHGTGDRLVPFANVAYMERQFRRARPLELMILEHRNHHLPWHSKPAIDRALARALTLTAGR